VHNEVEILPDALDHTPVDNRLLQLAKENRGTILTTDYNLGMVAKTMDIDVLNVNDLAIELRSDYLPGERMRIKITALGSNPKQGVGYLPDGMMVVVDEAATLVGRFVEIEFVKFLQTNSGRMMFAKVATQTRPSGRFGRGAGRKIKTKS
jgi:pilT protein-like protein